MRKTLCMLSLIYFVVFAVSCVKNENQKGEFAQENEQEMSGGLGRAAGNTSYIKNKQMNIPYDSQSKSQTLDIYFPNEQSR